VRRGWMDWLPEEVPREKLVERIEQVAQACQAQSVDALLLYSGFTRPVRVSVLTHFVPFWSQAALVVTRDGQTMLTMATTGRTVQWIRQCAVVDEVRVGPDIGHTAGQWLHERGLGRSLALADRGDWPQAALDGLKRAMPDAVLQLANGWYDPLDAGFGPTAVVAARALELARGGLAQVDALGRGSLHERDAHEIVAAIDGYCRARGAEEVSVLVATDVRRSARLQRLEGPTRLGSHFAVQLSVAYKGHWLRCGSSFMRDGPAVVEWPACAEWRQRVQQASIPPGAQAGQWVAQFKSGSASTVMGDWSLESRSRGLPLVCIAAPGHAEHTPVPRFSTLTARLRSEGQEWLVAEPIPLS
jgi:hypothetical protein